MGKLSSAPYISANLEGVSISGVMKWLNKPYDDRLIQNKVGNRIIYPQVVAIDPEDMEIDLAILRERLKIDPNLFYRPLTHRIIIPENFIQKYPDLGKLAWAFVDAFRPVGITALTLQSAGGTSRNLGSVIHPQMINPLGMVELSVKGKKYTTNGGLLTIPANFSKVDIQFHSELGTLLGEKTIVAEVPGGLVGIILDARN